MPEILNNTYEVNGVTYSAKTGQPINATPNSFPMFYGQPPDTKPVSTISTDQAISGLNKAKETETKLIGAPPTPTNTTKLTIPEGKTPTSVNQPGQTKVSLINPSTGQTVVFEDASINRASIESYLKSGYQMESAAGAVPSWLSTSGNSTSVTPKTDGEIKLEKAMADVETLTSKLTNFNVSNDPQLQSLLTSITSQWDSRIQEMDRANKSRIAAIGTTGIRMGSRYTGGAGGTMGGIVSAEEKDAVQRIATLEGQKQQALVDAKMAYEKQQWDRYSKLVDLAEKSYDNQLEEIKTLSKAQVETDKKLKEQQRLNDVEEGVSTALGLGIEAGQDIFDALNKSPAFQGLNASSKEISDALKNFVGEKSEEKLAGDLGDFTYLKKNGMLPDSILKLAVGQQFLAYKKMLKAAETAVKKGGAGDVGSPTNFDQFSKESIALSVVPGQLKNSEVELKRLLDGIRMGLKEGKNPYEVADVLMGYKIEEPNEFSDGIRKYIALADMGGTDISNMARLINAGKTTEALSMVENKVMDLAKKTDPDGYIGEATTRYYVQKVNEINKLLDDAGFFDSVGPFEGTMERALGKFRGKEAAKIRAQTTSLVVGMLKHLAGTDVTDSERAFLEPLIPSLSDRMGNFKTKTGELKGNSLTKLNTVRNSYELPTLREAELLDRGLRSELYVQNDMEEPSDTATDDDYKSYLEMINGQEEEED